MNLEDLTPKRSEIHLKAAQRSYYMRPWTLRDKLWLQETYGERLSEVFNAANPDIEQLARVAYRLIEDKTDFIKREVKVIDENGEEVTKTMGGFAMLLEMISGPIDELAIFEAINNCIGFSQPSILDNSKKKAKIAQ